MANPNTEHKLITWDEMCKHWPEFWREQLSGRCCEVFSPAGSLPQKYSLRIVNCWNGPKRPCFPANALKPFNPNHPTSVLNRFEK